MSNKMVRVIANSSVDRATRCKTVNISTAPHPQHQWKAMLQATGPAANPLHNEYPTVIAAATGAGPFSPGFETVYISGYTGPA